MTDLLAADYAWQHPDPAAIRAAGYTAVLRYVSADPTKDLSATEATGLHDAGLGIGLIYETTAQRALSSTIGGGNDAMVMRIRMRQLGCPAGTPALVNVGDWGVLPEQVGTVQAYYDAWRAGLQEYAAGAGGYGTSGIIHYLAADYPDDIWWENAINDLGFFGDQVNPSASLYQRVRPTLAIPGAIGEYDESVYGFGPRPSLAWWGTSAPVPAPPAPTADWWPTMPEIRQGASGPAVRTLQGLLLARYFHLGTTGQARDGIDGSFGPLTDAAVRTFQGQAHLVIDGIVGPKTWPALAGIS